MLTTKILAAAAVLALGACASPAGPSAPSDDERADPIAARQAGLTIPPVDVHVTNSVSDPVKTAAVGTTQVAGGVSAAQAGAWNVGILSMPTVSAAQSGPWATSIVGDVSLAPGAEVTAAQGGAPWSMTLDGTANVKVVSMPQVAVASLPAVAVTSLPPVNVASMPPVTVTVDPGSIQVSGESEQQPFGHEVNATLPAGSTTADVGNYVIPAGKRLILQHVSAVAEVPAGQTAWVSLRVVSDPNEASPDYAIPMRNAGPSRNGYDLWIASEPIRVLGIGGRLLQVTINRMPGATTSMPQIFFQVSTAGYLIDAP